MSEVALFKNIAVLSQRNKEIDSRLQSIGKLKLKYLGMLQVAKILTFGGRSFLISVFLITSVRCQ